MDDTEWLAERFEERRAHLRGVAYKMLGSLSEADDAVQETWLRLSRDRVSGVDNLTGWLTTVVGRVCLDLLRSRKVRREEPLDTRLPDPIVGRADGSDPEDEALLADSIGLALLVVLDTLSPAERVAFVLHDMFAVPFEEIAQIVDRSPSAARQLASRARRRVRGAPVPDADLKLQREVVDAFLAAAREGDFEALVATLDPDVVVRADGGALAPGLPREVRGARAAAQQALLFSHRAGFARPALVNGAAGVVAVSRGRPLSVMGFTIVGGKIVEIDILASAARLRRLDLAALED
ncbi:sigma-70 family RNA polymerase sigma factor [Mycobacterium riyadhense]|uniref:RNA polymerase subunit sigma-70 n=1 Tax=Mycobacterium riyadhense TaxID=486698 RepID=A0A1X2CCI0_9MYCO|nr:sigma-70 family RNA polymerase sigma factor [Mycobacterium riyadhense]MCV7144481.1 sigma-70 family RNA polymerase sigma factor [Mycobacterium riyadhense]ORW73521.1 RNA polymerase subunit sigma-70 [Mycobacterium riyadhense]